MDFINLHTSVLDSEEFKAATVAQRGTWLSLYRYCAGQENSGRIAAARTWTDRFWRQICGISLREVVSENKLWRWEDDTLVLEFYNLESEANVHRLRSQAAAGAHARWNRKAKPDAMPSVMPKGIPSGTPSGNGDGNAKGKEKEGKEKEGKETGPGKPGGKQLGHLPAEQPSPIRERMLAINALKHRRDVARWSAKEWAAFKAAGLDTCSDDDFAVQIEPLTAYYAAEVTELRGYWNAKDPASDFRRRDLETLLTNWPGEVDRATAWCHAVSKKLEVQSAGRL